MKRLLFGLCLLVLVSVGGRVWQQKKTVSTPLPSPSLVRGTMEPLLGLAKNEAALVGFEVDGKSYRMAWHLISPTASVRMGVNTDLASSSGDLFAQQQCAILTSGGFYTTEGKPIGLLIVDAKEISPWQQNQLFNGVLGSDGTHFSISRGDVSTTPFTWAVQAGPVLWIEGEVTTLTLKNDQSARRILAGVTTDGSLVLMAVVNADSLFGGPTLADVGSLIPAISRIVGKEFEAVINLDGGTASALISDSISLRELKPIGSYVCVE